MEKAAVIEHVRATLEAQYEQMLASAKETSAGATDPENKAEGKYDTRGLEASYLAAGQGEQVAELAAALEVFQTSTFPDFEPGAEIAAGALVEADFGGELSYFLLAPKAGGLTCEHNGHEVTVLTPEAPLRQKMMGLKAGDLLPQPPLQITRVQ